MKSNTKFTALELLIAAKVEKPEEKFGKGRVRIAGIAGIVKPNHLITLGKDVKKVDLIVGIDNFEIELEGSEEDFVVTEEAKKVLKEKGVKITKTINARIAAKKAEAEKAKVEEVETEEVKK